MLATLITNGPRYPLRGTQPCCSMIHRNVVPSKCRSQGPQLNVPMVINLARMRKGSTGAADIVMRLARMRKGSIGAAEADGALLRLAADAAGAAETDSGGLRLLIV
eukprot:550117-Prymnesium_polylepis.1